MTLRKALFSNVEVILTSFYTLSSKKDPPSPYMMFDSDMVNNNTFSFPSTGH